MSRRVGPYVLEQPLGRGSMGEVHVAVRPDGSRVALKLLTRVDDRSARRFSREFSVGKGLDHPNLVRVLESGTDQGVPWLAMELLPGRTLGAILKERRRIPPDQALALIQQIAAALTYLHAQKVVHRDLKPDNVMVDAQGRVKVMDLGMIRVSELTALTATGTVAGTPFYMAPENLEGKPAAPASDLFSAALIAYEMLTGRHAFRAPGHADLAAYYRHLVSARPDPVGDLAHRAALDAFFETALAVEPGPRPPTAGALVAGLAAALRGEGPVAALDQTVDLALPSARAPRPGATPSPDRSAAVPRPAPRPPARRRTALLLAGAGLAAGAWVLSPSEPAATLREVSLLQGASRRWIVAAVEPGIPLRLGTAEPGGEDRERRVQAFEVPAGVEALELRTRGGQLLLAREAETGAYAGPPAPTLEYSPDGALAIAFPRIPLVTLALREPSGREPTPQAGGPGGPRFSLADPGVAGFPPLEVLARVGLSELAWGKLPAQPAAAVMAAALVQRLRTLDVVELARRAETDPDPARMVLDALMATRAAGDLPLLAAWLADRLAFEAPEDEEAVALLIELPKLRFLDALLHHLRATAPVDLESSGLADLLAPVAYAEGEPSPAPSILLFELNQDRFMTEIGETRATIASPESLFAQRFGTRRVGSPPGNQGPIWLDLHVRRVKTFAPRFFAVARVNGQGPFLLFENPRLGAELRHGESGGPWFNRRYRIRIPRRWLRPEGNDLELRFLPWTTRYLDPESPEFQYQNLNDAACIQAVALRTGP